MKSYIQLESWSKIDKETIRLIKSIDIWSSFNYEPSLIGSLVCKEGVYCCYLVGDRFYYRIDDRSYDRHASSWQFKPVWYDIPDNYNVVPFSFVFDNSSPDLQQKMLYHLNLLDFG